MQKSFPFSISVLRFAILLLSVCAAFFPAAADDDSRQLTYLALGDSYTIGEAVEKAERWPEQLVQQLGKKQVNVGVPRIIAKTGWTTDELLAAIQEENPTPSYDMVTLLIGVNNQYRGRDVDVYRSEFERLLKMAIEFAQGEPNRVIVVSIPDYGVTPFIAGKDRDPKQIAQQLDVYNHAAKEITGRHQANWVDITPVSRECGGEQRMLAEDQLHPSGAMYGLWTKEVISVAERILATSDH